MKSQRKSPGNKTWNPSRVGIHLLSLLILPVSLLWNTPMANAQPPHLSQLVVTRSDDQGVVLELRLAGYQLEEKSVDGSPCYLLSAEGVGQSDQAGWPLIPIQRAKLGLPPDSIPEIHILDVDSTSITLSLDLCPIPTPVIREESRPDDPWPSDAEVQLVNTRDKQAYATDAFYPAELAMLAGEGYLRDQRFVELELRPFQYNPARKELRVHRYLQLEVGFHSSQENRQPRIAGETDGPFEAVLSHTILNYDSARQWRQKPAAQRSSEATAWTPPEPAYKVAVNQDGLYRLTFADLMAAGAPLDTLDPRTLQLLDNGHELAIHVTGEDDGHFDPGDEILFYGQALDTRYTDTNVYWLTYGAASGRRMATRDGAPTGTAPAPSWFGITLHLEENHTYLSSDRINTDHWYWNYLCPPTAPTQTYNFTLTHLVSEPYTVTLRTALSGWQTWDHHARLYLNEHQVAAATWSGRTGLEINASFPSAYLQEGDNTIVVEGEKPPNFDYDLFFTDWFDLGYRRLYRAEYDRLAFDSTATGTWQFAVGGFSTEAAEVYDVTGPADVVRIVNYATVLITNTYTITFEDSISAPKSYRVLTAAKTLTPWQFSAATPPNLKSPANGADYLIITHGDFLSQAQRLADYRQGQPGIARALVVDVQDIYDEFNDGEMSAEAIRTFLQYTYNSWQLPAPSYVLLLGDGHYDFRNFTGTAPVTRIPPYLLFLSDSLMGESAADNQYVCLSGDDRLADMYIGRLPADSLGEAQAMVDKIIAYETNPFPGDWIYNVFFTADNPDGAGDFYALSNHIADNYLPTTYAPRKSYLGDTCPYENPAVTCRQTIVSAISQGSLFSNYVGHGGPGLWAGESLLRTRDIGTLSNSGRLPVQLSFTCYTGVFHYPNSDGLDESLVLAAGKGAIASWGNADLSYAFLDQWVHEGFYAAVFEHELWQLGPAIAWAKAYYHDQTASPLLLERKHLFGDPALTISHPADPNGVRLSYFGAVPQGHAIHVEWQTATEVDLLGFNLYSAESPDGVRSRLNDSLIPGQMPGSPVGASYEFADESVRSGITYYYWLELLDIYGGSTWTDSIDARILYQVFLPLVNR